MEEKGISTTNETTIYIKIVVLQKKDVTKIKYNNVKYNKYYKSLW